MEKNQEFCPQCPNHCHKSELRCGRGKAYFGLEENMHNDNGGRQLNGIAGLLKQCGLMHHNPEIDNVMLCKGLSHEEEQTLEGLLNKVLSNLK